MASLSSSRYLLAITFILLYFKTVFSDFNVTFTTKNANKDPNFESRFDFYGDTKLVSTGDNMSLQLFGGRVFYKEPIKLVEGNPRKMVSFAMNFVFSLSSGKNGDGLAFLMAPVGYPVKVFDGGSFGVLNGSKLKFLAVEFDTLRVAVDSFVSIKAKNVSSRIGEKLQSWINYEANSQSLEVRLAKFGEIMPVDPLLLYAVDLSRMWDKGEVLFSLGSASKNSSQKCNLYSWSLKLRTVPHWMHSQPLDPAAFVEKKNELKVHEKSDCALRILAVLIFGTGCGALGALLVLFVWTLLGCQRPEVPVAEDYAVKHVGFEYKKAKVVDKSIKDGKNQLSA